MENMKLIPVDASHLRGLLVVDRNTGHAEFRILLGYQAVREKDGTLIEYQHVLLGRDGETRVPLENRPELYTQLVFHWHEETIPSTDFVASGADIRRNTIQWDHLAADLDEIREQLSSEGGRS